MKFFESFRSLNNLLIIRFNYCRTMSLVADYGSDSEGNENIEESLNQQEDIAEQLNMQSKQKQSSTDPQSTNKIRSSQQTEIIPNSIDSVLENNLFSALPQKKLQPQHFIRNEDPIENFIPKLAPPNVKEKQRAKISIPSLSEFKDDQDSQPDKKTLKLSIKGSGLLSVLPPVKGTIKTAKSFIPNILTNKNRVTTNNTLTRKSSVQEKKVLEKKNILSKKGRELAIQNDAESEDEDIEVPETFDEEMWLKVCSKPKPKAIIKEPEPVLTELPVDIAPEPEKPYDGLDNEAFKELVGKSKRPIGNIKLIDINEEEILPDKDLWMTKSLTDPEMAPKANIEDPVDPTRRKKHHITYLAQQAKANEQELANAWAASKNSRLASRAKYGF